MRWFLWIFLLGLFPLGLAQTPGKTVQDDVQKAIEDYFNSGDGRGQLGSDIIDMLSQAFGQAGCTYEGPKMGVSFEGFYEAILAIGQVLCTLKVSCLISSNSPVKDILPLPVDWGTVETSAHASTGNVVGVGRGYFFPSLLTQLVHEYKAETGERWPLPPTPPPGIPWGGMGAQDWSGLKPKAYFISASEDLEDLRRVVLDLLKEDLKALADLKVREASTRNPPPDPKTLEVLRQDIEEYRDWRATEPLGLVVFPFGIASPAEDTLGEVRQKIVANLPALLVASGVPDQFGVPRLRVFLLLMPPSSGRYGRAVVEAACQGLGRGNPARPQGFAGLELYGRIPKFFGTVVNNAVPFLGVAMEFAQAMDERDRQVARGLGDTLEGR